ncbi:glycogen synthase GlgA [Roseiarcaceae bacterium H3SJ34-1]|uniref:glycogen synthase GlgA n=1 Tax=Terripilifer ovatus TaxID=3032367 RepID=UPI003AB9205A|nr:glycogen synthase GlgA [Roseiarcaceae bacterium H3SJ34-1]
MSCFTLNPHPVAVTGQGGLSARVAATPRGKRKVLFVTSEMSDFVQTGGLGEVSAALPRALRSTCDVRVLIPGYRQVLERQHAIEPVAHLPGRGEIPPCDLGRMTTPDGLVVYVLMAPRLYNRDGTPYLDIRGNDWVDNDIRFARLGLAAADMATGFGDPGWQPDNLHLNDWPTSLASGYLAWRGSSVPSILTIHNLAYQGSFDAARLGPLGIPQDAYCIDGVEFYGKLSFLKAGLQYSSHLTTVSSTYAAEITTPELGCGLDGLLLKRSREGRLTGIVNGIEDTWTPHHGGGGDTFDAARWKSRHADYVRGTFGLQLAHGPLFAIISRLVHQKGVDLAIEAADTIVAHGGQLVVTGEGDPRLEQGMRDLALRHRGAVGVRIGFDRNEARAMFAGSDFLLMPSRFEPCGLSQMYAQKFGSLPIAHRTGGLADTISDGQTGFLFGAPTAGGLNTAIKRGFEAFVSSSRLALMRRAAMSMSFGWDHSASRYADTYRMAEAA